MRPLADPSASRCHRAVRPRLPSSAFLLLFGTLAVVDGALADTVSTGPAEAIVADGTSAADAPPADRSASGSRAIEGKAATACLVRPERPTSPEPPPTTSPPDGPGELALGTDATPPSGAWSRPALGNAYTDPAYGTAVRRVGDATDARFDRTVYSRRQAESADGDRFLTYHGSGEYRVYDRATLQLVRRLEIHEQGEPQWHPSDPDRIRHLSGPKRRADGLKLFETRVSTGQESVVADLGDRVRAVFPSARYMRDLAEGSPSADGDRHAWIAHDDGGDALGLISYDLAGDRLLGTRPVRRDRGRLDWVSMSPTGRHVVVGYERGTLLYDRTLQDERRIDDKVEHSDIALDAAGRDAYVKMVFSAADDGWLVSIDLDTLRRTRLFSLYESGSNTSLHVSGKAYGKRGWALLSTYNCRSPGGWACNKIIAVQLKQDPLIVNLAHTYNCAGSYWSEPHATVNDDFTRVYYNSDAGSCGGAAEVYELTVPALP